MGPFSSEITQVLNRLTNGDPAALDELLPLVYKQLKSHAHRHLRGERSSHTLNTTALVHEAYLKLVDQRQATWQNRAHFLSVASQAMRRILIDYARARLAQKRAGKQIQVTFNEEIHGGVSRVEELVTFNEILTQLQKLDQRQAQIVEYAFFGGLTHEEIAEVLGVSLATVGRDWRMARAFISKQLREETKG